MTKTKPLNKSDIQDKLEDMFKEFEVASLKNKDRQRNLPQWISFNDDAEEILEKYDVEKIGEGASRTVFSFKYQKEMFVFKLVIGSWAPLYGLDDDSHIEANAVENMSKNKYQSSLVLPLVHTYNSNTVGCWVNIFPMVEAVGYVSGYNEFDEYNESRNTLFDWISNDAHSDNVGLWKGLIWLIDINVDNSNRGEKVLLEIHKKNILDPASKKGFNLANKLVKLYTAI